MTLGGVTLGLREAVIALIVLVAAYMLFVLLRMRHLRSAGAQEEGSEDVQASSALDDATPGIETRDDESPSTEVFESRGLAGQILVQGLEREVAQLRDEVDAVRGELAALREDMLGELAHMRATQTVSPIYGDAMQMAVAGYDAAMIAERCGIARAEAELVASLAKSRER